MSVILRLGRLCALVALAVALCLGSWGTLQAQTTSASVTGVVMDSSRAVMPGVTVTLTSRSQGDTLTTVTDAEGRFVFTIVRPDTYILRASLDGFKTLEQTNLVVNANDRLSAGTLMLEVGSLQESVTVTSRVSELQTTSGERSFAISNEALTNIANNGRQLFNFATLVPGVAMQGDGAGREMTQVSSFTVNGQRPNANNMTIDGVANIDTGDNGGNMASTNIDSVAEFKVLTNAYQAEYGRAVGGQIQVVTKSGTQDFKGSAYWYGRRSDWNATSWINNRDNLVTPKASRDDRGYTIGGPDLHPGGFNADRRKLFFFWSQEYQSRKDPANERRATVPTALERAGDFSQSVDSGGRPFPYIRDYTTGLPCSASDTRGCFQHQGVLGRIPPDRLYALGLTALNIYPMPNGSFGGGQNFSSQDPKLAAPRGPDPRRRAGHRQLARHRPLHEPRQHGPAGLRHDLGRQRQQPAAHAGDLQEPRTELDGLGDRHPELDDVAGDEPRQRQERARLHRSSRATGTGRRPGSPTGRTSTRMRSSGTTSRSSTSAVGARATRASSRPTTAPSPTGTGPMTWS
jgi:hypothetical protein